MTIKIYIAAHKQYPMPTDTTYQPIFVGADINGALPAGYLADNDGQNISAKNPNYNELTAIYWIWKHCHADVKGLMQYRRYLSTKPNEKLAGVLSKTQINQLLARKTIILPKQRHYLIESNYSHYVHAHHAEPLDEMRKVVAELYPDYLKNFDRVMHRTSAHMFNMMIMPAKDFDAYAAWLFSILFAVEKRIDISDYDAVEARVFGYLSELLLDVWLRQNKISYTEVPVMYTEGKHLAARGFNLLKRKFLPNAQKQTHF